MKLVLFDIDGTLLSAAGAAVRAINAVFQRRYLVGNAMDGIEAAGRTDPAIVRDMVRRNLGRDILTGEAEEIFREYGEILRGELEHCPRYRVMPGVPRLLHEFSLREEIVVGLATGNIEPGARLKLERPGLNGYFPFGGFGSDSEHREQVISIAIERGRAYLDGREGFEEVIVVGDTHYDIVHGRAAGARVVAVATGTEPLAHLERHNPEHLLRDLSDTEEILKILTVKIT